MFESCNGDVYKFYDNKPCPHECSGNGVCRNNRCLCYQGFYGSFSEKI